MQLSNTSLFPLAQALRGTRKPDISKPPEAAEQQAQHQNFAQSYPKPSLFVRNARRANGDVDPVNHVAPPSIMQMKISLMLEEQAQKISAVSSSDQSRSEQAAPIEGVKTMAPQAPAWATDPAASPMPGKHDKPHFENATSRSSEESSAPGGKATHAMKLRDMPELQYGLPFASLTPKKRTL